MRPVALALFMFALGCAPARDEKVNDVNPERRTRVLVTGFNDWKDLGDPPNVWRCRDNPSCRLLIGDAVADPPSAFEGPLVVALRDASDVEWRFATLPVTWGVASEHTAYGDYDAVVHLGLGVYDRDDELFVEADAYNLREGVDAAGKASQGPIRADGGSIVAAPSHVASAVAAIDGRRFGAMRVRAKPARVENTYLCNETHATALQAVRRSAESGGRLHAAYFVHIPQPNDDDWRALAESVAGLITALVQR